MRQKIVRPYILSDAEQKTVKDKFAIHTDWEKECFNNIKDNLIAHLRIEQDHRCCYCKRKLDFDLKNVEIDHIVAKSTRSDFTFEPLNLSLSCPGCNTIKNNANVCSSKFKLSRKSYPKNPMFFSIVHAHFDNYSEHIRVQNDCVYIPLSKKGSHTITLCGLYRLQEVVEKAKMHNMKGNENLELLEKIRTTKDVKVLAQYMKVITEQIQEAVS